MTTEATSPAVALFQKVHGKMVMLQRLDSQLHGLLEQRRKVQQEIQALQGQINEEIDRQLRIPGVRRYDACNRPLQRGGMFTRF